MSFAQGKRAFGFCDRCGFRYPLKSLKTEFYLGRPVHNRVCPDCWDTEHPQNWLGRTPIYDPIALRDPRPDPAQSQVASAAGWNPIPGVKGTGSVGTVTVALPRSVTLDGVSASGAVGTITVVT